MARPKFRVQEVDGRANSRLLQRLQREILPADIPTSTFSGWWWIVYHDGQAIGFAGLYPSKQFSQTVYLCRAGIAEEFRGHGLQKRLIKARIKKARNLGTEWAVTDTYENPESGNSLIRCGFRLYQPSRPWGADGVNYWRLCLWP